MAIITEDYVSFEVAKLLKEKGFDWNCESKKFYPEPYYDQESPDGVYSPTLQTAMKWLREVYKIHIFVEYSRFDFDKEIPYIWNIVETKIEGDYIWGSHYSTFEEAVDAAIKYCLINLIK